MNGVGVVMAVADRSGDVMAGPAAGLDRAVGENSRDADVTDVLLSRQL